MKYDHLSFVPTLKDLHLESFRHFFSVLAALHLVIGTALKKFTLIDTSHFTYFLTNHHNVPTTKDRGFQMIGPIVPFNLPR